MNNRKAFTIIELLISLTLSSFIMLGMIQAYRNLDKCIDRSRQIVDIDRNVCVLFNQMERDFSQAFIASLSKEIKKDEKSGKSSDEKKEKASESKISKDSKDEEKELVAAKDFFIASVYENETIRINRKRYELFKNVNFITTSTLQVWGQKRIRFVRVFYELLKDKERSKGETVCYKLYRKETTELTNVKMKEDEYATPSDKKIHSIRTYLVADNVKDFYVEFIIPEIKEDEKSETKEAATSEVKELNFFTWGDKKENTGKLPQRAEIHISFWNDSLTESKNFQATFPFYIFTTRKEKEEKIKEDKAKELEEKKAKLEKTLQAPEGTEATSETQPQNPNQAQSAKLPGAA